MALTNDGNLVMPVSPMYGNGGFGGFGGDFGEWLIVLILFGMFNGGMWGMGGFGGGLGYDFPWLLNGQNGINANTNAGFNQAATQSAISALQNSVTSGFGDVQLGLAGVNQAICQTGNGITQQMYANQIADLNRSFAAQTASTQGMNAIQGQIAQASADNRLGIAGIGSDIAREACATRTNDTQNTQVILNAINGGIQSVKDQIFADRLDDEKRENANLRQQIAMKDLAASQIAQNAFISQGFANEVDQLYNRLNSCPVPTTPVYGRTPIFQCNNNGCGCNGNFYN